MKRYFSIITIVLTFLPIGFNRQQSESGSVFSQENLKQHKSRQDKIVEKIMDLSNRNYTELTKYLQDRDLIIEDKLITIMLDNNLGERPQRRAVWALGVIGSDKVINLFLEKLRDKNLDIYVRHDMADVLGDQKLQKTVDPLIDIFNDKDIDPIVRRRISNALAKIKSIKAVDHLIKALDEDDQYIREGAVYALGKIGTNRAANILVNLLEDENVNVRRTANSLLRILKPDMKVDLLLGSLEDDFLYHSETAIKELSAMGDSVVDELHDEIIGKNDFIRWQILRILGRIKSKKSVNLFLETINDKDEKIRNECAVGLAGIKTDVSVFPLIKMLDSNKPETKETAAWILSETGSEEAVEPLVNLLNEENSGWFAAMSLGKIGNKTAIGSLEILLKSDVKKSRQAAIWAIERINNKYADQKVFNNLLDYYDTQINCPVYPKLTVKKPDIPSPVFFSNFTEYIVGLTKNQEFAVIPVTLVNNRNKDKEWGEKGRQLDVDSADFPTLARTGLHSEIELDFTKSITGKSISEINYLAKPDMSSGWGFISGEEDIISVLRGDNRLIHNMGLRQPDIILPLFHVWNMVVAEMANDYWKSEALNIEGIYYNNNYIHITAGGRGFQESIFDDEVRGALHLAMWRDPDREEENYLADKYSHLSGREMEDFKKKLFYIHTGEMVTYYARWYGFYEGHTGYRADPIAIACIFGLKSLEELDIVFDGKLDKVLTKHFTKLKIKD